MGVRAAPVRMWSYSCELSLWCAQHVLDYTKPVASRLDSVIHERGHRYMGICYQLHSAMGEVGYTFHATLASAYSGCFATACYSASSGGSASTSAANPLARPPNGVHDMYTGHICIGPSPSWAITHTALYVSCPTRRRKASSCSRLA